MKGIILLMTLIWMGYYGVAQNNHPVSWTFSSDKVGESNYTIKFEATVKEPYHIYPQQSFGGLGMPTQFLFDENPNIELIGSIDERGVEQKEGESLPYYSKGVTFTQKLKLKSKKPTTLSFTIKFMACTDQMCLPPSKKQFTLTVGVIDESAAKGVTANTSSRDINSPLAWEHFSMPNTEGKIRSTKSIISKNKYTFIDFWASWCAPCRKQARELVPLYSKYHDRGFEVIGVSLDTETSAWKKAIKDDKYNWPNLSDLKGFESPIIKKFGITQIPRNMLINDQGVVVATDLHGDELQIKLAELFKKFID